jgi:signal transduction histidine kinase
VRRRILIATLSVTASALVIFGVLLGWSVGRVDRGQQLTRLQQAATLAAAAVPGEGLHGADPVEPPPVPAGIELAYYDAGGALAAGHGPARADVHSSRALGGQPSQGTAGSRLVVAVPVTANETTVGAVEASSARAAVMARAVRTWLIMAALGVIVLGLAALIAVRQARRLARPVDTLVAAADRLGAGDFALTASESGIAELDRAAVALEATAGRLGQLLDRERAFTAHASHQLRTPLTALRLDLENALQTPGVDVRAAVTEALGQVDRVEETLEELLALARTGETADRRIALGDILAPLEQRWHPILASQGRRLHVLVADESMARQPAPASLAQILDILLDNATTHGQGTVEVAADTDVGWISIEVTDEGTGIAAFPEPSSPAKDSPGDGHGLGLPLARSLAQGAGGALVLKHPGPHPIIGVLVP